jgi:hypothetical protein
MTRQHTYDEVYYLGFAICRNLEVPEAFQMKEKTLLTN